MKLKKLQISPGKVQADATMLPFADKYGVQEGVKYDMGKPPIGWIPRSALEAEAMVLAFGGNKYGRDNWRKGMEWQRVIDAALRHIVAFAEGENEDPESGLHHLAHAKCCLSFLIEYQTKGIGVDDRAAVSHE